jgi:hypothetical protein
VVHIYRKDGEYYPSVTTIIGEMIEEPERLTQWKNKNRDWEKKTGESQIVGTLVHYRILNELAPQTLETPDIDFENVPKDALKKVELGQIMWDELGLEVGYPRRIEQFAICRQYKFAGKPDLEAPINGIYTLVDLKTSSDIYETHKLQMGGYHELRDRVFEQAMLVSLHPNERRNSFMRAHKIIMPRKELDEYADRFVELANEFHKKNLTEKLIKEHEIEWD